MLGTIDSLEFVLAETLGKTLGEVRAIPNSEFVEWRAFFTVRAEMERLHRAGK